jgi:hypothetical protein
VVLWIRGGLVLHQLIVCVVGLWVRWCLLIGSKRDLLRSLIYMALICSALGRSLGRILGRSLGRHFGVMAHSTI